MYLFRFYFILFYLFYSTFTNIYGMGRKGLTLTLRRAIHNKNSNLYPLASTSTQSKYVTNAVNINELLHYGPKNDREAVYYFYYKHKDFFIRILTSLKWAITSHATDKYYCHKVHLPGDFDWKTSFGIEDNERTFMITGKDILSLYGKMFPCNNFDNRCRVNSIGGIYRQPCLKDNLATIQGARGGIPLYKLPKPLDDRVKPVIDRALMYFEVGRFNYRNPVFY